MHSWRVLIIVLVATLTFGGALNAAAPALAAPIACHESGHQPGSSQKQKPAQVAVNCCAGCLTAPSQIAAAQLVFASPVQPYRPAPDQRLDSLAHAPEPHPPRLV